MGNCEEFNKSLGMFPIFRWCVINRECEHIPKSLFP